MSTPAPVAPTEVPLVDRLRSALGARYVVHDELGRGGMATVFRATEVALEREVAIKVMNASMATTPGAFDRFRREARVAAALSHPHIVPIYAIGDDPALAWFAMKYVEGRGLDDILRAEGAQGIETVVRTVATVGRALQHAHEKGVVHRDVKPANIMVGDDGWVFVADFGIAKRDDAQQLTQAGTVVGTPAYMAPEQFNGHAVTGAADQYALGIVAYEMLAGRTPFDAPSLGEIIRGHLLDAPPPLRLKRIDVPTGVAECVNRMLEKDPARRFPSLAHAVEALETAVPAARLSAAGGRRTTGPNIPHVAAAAPTTPIPRASAAAVTSGARAAATTSGSQRRASTAPSVRTVEEPSGGGASLVRVLLLAVLLAAGGWYALRDRFTGTPAASAIAATPPPGDAVPDDAAYGSTPDAADAGATAAGVGGGAPDAAPAGDAAATAAPIDSAIADLSLRLATAPSIDLVAPPDSVVVRIGSQMLETVLFVNERQVGVIGGRGLLEVVAPPGPVAVAIRKLGCQAWDTTFAGLEGRRYTFMERSPTCR